MIDTRLKAIYGRRKALMYAIYIMWRTEGGTAFESFKAAKAAMKKYEE